MNNNTQKNMWKFWLFKLSPGLVLVFHILFLLNVQEVVASNFLYKIGNYFLDIK